MQTDITKITESRAFRELTILMLIDGYNIPKTVLARAMQAGAVTTTKAGHIDRVSVRRFLANMGYGKPGKRNTPDTISVIGLMAERKIDDSFRADLLRALDKGELKDRVSQRELVTWAVKHSREINPEQIRSLFAHDQIERR